MSWPLSHPLAKSFTSDLSTVSHLICLQCLKLFYTCYHFPNSKTSSNMSPKAVFPKCGLPTCRKENCLCLSILYLLENALGHPVNSYCVGSSSNLYTDAISGEDANPSISFLSSIFQQYCCHFPLLLSVLRRLLSINILFCMTQKSPKTPANVLFKISIQVLGILLTSTGLVLNEVTH